MTPRDPFAELHTALSLTPSPEFAARARARVTSAPSPRQSLVPHWTIGALLAAAAAVLVAVNVSERNDEHAAPLNIVTAPSVAATPTVPSTPTAVITSVDVLPRIARITTKAPAATADPFYEVLVPDDQRIALERLLRAMKAGRASVPASTVTAATDDDGLLSIALLPDIVPMKIELLVEIKKEK